MKKILFLLFWGIISLPMTAICTVPDKLRYCDIELNLNADARAKIEESITKLKPASLYFRSLVDRANIFFPFIDEAFALRGVPQDLKYIVIMESSLNAVAVSSSNAVGFWQFKVESGRESGLAIDEFVDERKHIFLSSLAAAKYFYTIARYYDNYLYATIGYNRGPLGAMPFTDEKGFGSRKLDITGETHWYALHAIAYKLAFEDAVGKTDPPMWLQPLSSHGETDVKRLAEAQNLSLEDFKKYNAWINGSQLPAGKDYIYYVPRQGKPELALMQHVGGSGAGKQIGGNTPTKVIEKPKPAVDTQRDTRKFSYLEPNDDPDYGVEYVRVKKGEGLVEIAVRNGVKVKKLQEYNGVTNSYRAAEGDILYLKAPQSRHHHIVQAGESLKGISEKYESTPEKLREKNHLNGSTVFAGQKLSLKKKVAKGQKPTLLATPILAEEIEEVVVPIEVKEQPKETLATGTGLMQMDPSSYRLPAFESKIVLHTVGPKESLWKIAKKYGAWADVIKKLNNMSSSEVSPGQQLKVLQVTDR